MPQLHELSSLIATEITEKGEFNENSYPIGIIEYRNGLVGVTNSPSGQLQASVIENRPPDAALAGISSRVLKLADTDNIYIGQIGLGSVDVKRFPTISHPHDNISANIVYRDVLGNTERTLHLDEVEIAEALAGEKGGLSIFNGHSLREEIALVLYNDYEGMNSSNETEKKREALVAFFTPNKNEGGLNSVRGAYEFFQKLNRELLANTTLDSRLSAQIHRLYQYSEKKELDEGSARLELFIASILSHWILSIEREDKGVTDKLNQLKSYLPRKTGPDIIDLFFTLVTQKPQDARPSLSIKKGVVQAVNTMLVNGKLPQTSAEKKPILKQDSPLTSENGKILWDQYRKQMGDQFGNYDDIFIRQTTDGYVKEIIGLAWQATTLEELNDVIAMINEISDTRYGSWREVAVGRQWKDWPLNERIVFPEEKERWENISFYTFKSTTFRAIAQKQNDIRKKMRESKLSKPSLPSPSNNETQKS